MNYQISLYDYPSRFLVEKGDTAYLVDVVDTECSCDDFKFRKRECKHIRLVKKEIKEKNNNIL